MNRGNRSLSKASTVQSAGRVVLVLIFFCLLAGTFSLDRVGGPALGVRTLGVWSCCVALMLWCFASAHLLRPDHAGAPMIAINVLFGFLMLSTLWSPQPWALSPQLLDLFVMSVLVNMAALLFSLLSLSMLRSVWIWCWWIAVFFFLGAVAAGPGAQGRYAAFGGGPNVFVRIMILGVVASAALAVVQKRLWALYGVPCFLAGALLSGSRGGLVALGVVGIILLAVIRRTRMRGAVWVLIALLLAGATFVYLVSSSSRQFLVERYFVLTFQQKYTSGRGVYFTSALNLFESHPLVGIGVGGFEALTSLEYPHNLVLAVAAESGVVGLALLGGSVVIATWSALQRSRRSVDSTFAVVAAGGILVASMFSGGYYDSRFLWFFLALAAYFASKPRSESAPVVWDEKAASSTVLERTSGTVPATFPRKGGVS